MNITPVTLNFQFWVPNRACLINVSKILSVWTWFTSRESQNSHSINYSFGEIQLIMFPVYNCIIFLVGIQYQFVWPFPGLELIPDRINVISWHGDSFTKCWPPDGCSRDLDGGETFSISAWHRQWSDWPTASTHAYRDVISVTWITWTSIIMLSSFIEVRKSYCPTLMHFS